ncbi:hypothetical protein PP1Y_Lpl55 (plasmid) [Novosphingobium sp. PP1Y]|nr:hypothetical protein PP1Y_Lpl55 [Novosphingobium sp. PP1Y]
MRTLTFERRVLIGYTVDRAVVTVQRIISASRDLVSVLHNS